MNITVIGGGNIGTLMAADCAKAGHRVTQYASTVEGRSRHIEVFDASNQLAFSADLAAITSDLETAISEADLIWVTYPVNAIGRLADRMLPFVQKEQMIGVAPGAFAEFFFARHVEKGCVLFGLQRVHSIARNKERGKSVYELGRKPELQVAAIPSKETMRVSQLVQDLLKAPVTPLPNYLVETLTPSNPILHTTRLRTMLADWKLGKSFDHNILFYEEWTDRSSRCLMACDEEDQKLCEALTSFDLTRVLPLSIYYESPTPEAMTKKISSIEAFKGLTSPLVEEEPGKWVPDFSHRYFKADFAYGLACIQKIARIVGVETPNIDEVIDWYVSVSGDLPDIGFVPNSKEEFLAIYK